MDILRYIDEDWHHYCVREPTIRHTIVDNFDIFKKIKANKKFSYLQDFKATDESLTQLESRITQHLEIADHVFVGFGNRCSPIRMKQSMDVITKITCLKDHITTLMTSLTSLPLMTG